MTSPEMLRIPTPHTDPHPLSHGGESCSITVNFTNNGWAYEGDYSLNHMDNSRLNEAERQHLIGVLNIALSELEKGHNSGLLLVPYVRKELYDRVVEIMLKEEGYESVETIPGSKAEPPFFKTQPPSAMVSATALKRAWEEDHLRRMGMGAKERNLQMTLDQYRQLSRKQEEEELIKSSKAESSSS